MFTKGVERGSAIWEKFPNNPVFFPECFPNGDGGHDGDDGEHLAGEHLGILLHVPLLQVIGKPSVST